MGWSESSSDLEMDLDVSVEDMQTIGYTRVRLGPIVQQNLYSLEESRAN